MSNPAEKLDFPIEEYERRLSELRDRMVKRGLDVVIIVEPANLTYLTGYQTTGYSYFQTLVVPLEKEPFMVTRLLEESNIFARTWVKLSRPFTDTGDAIESLWYAMKEFGLDGNKRIGYEKNCAFFRHEFQERIIQTFPQAEFFDCSGIVEAGRITKSPVEIELMKKAAIATEAGMKAGLAVVAEGVNENEIAAEVSHAMFKAGGEYPAVMPYITSGERTMVGHATWQGREVQRDECVFLEIGGCVRRYHTAMMRTAFVGEPSPEMWEAEGKVLQAIRETMKFIRPGVTVAEVDGLAREILATSTSGGKLLTRTGYSIGIAFAPSWDEGYMLSLKATEHTPLREGMTFHFIPWLVGVNDRHVMALSETLYVTADGCKSFFELENKLTVIS